MRTYIDHLPASLVGVDFRVLAPEGGYRELLNDVIFEGQDFLDVLAVHLAQEESFYVLLRVYVDRHEIALNGPEVRFEQCPAMILTENGEETGSYIDAYLAIHLDIVRDGITAGTLRMQRQSTADSLLEKA